MPYRSETQKIRARVQPWIVEPVIDIGCGLDKITPAACGVDRVILPGVDLAWNLEVRLPFPDEAFATVYSSHALEHLRDPQAALADWRRILRRGGHLILYLPHADLYTRANPEHLHELRPDGVRAWVGALGLEMVREEVDDDAADGRYSFLIVGRRA